VRARESGCGALRGKKADIKNRVGWQLSWRQNLNGVHESLGVGGGGGGGGGKAELNSKTDVQEETRESLPTSRGKIQCQRSRVLIILVETAVSEKCFTGGNTIRCSITTVERGIILKKENFSPARAEIFEGGVLVTG